MSVFHVVLIVLAIIVGLLILYGLACWAFSSFKDGGSWR